MMWRRPQRNSQKPKQKPVMSNRWKAERDANPVSIDEIRRQGAYLAGWQAERSPILPPPPARPAARSATPARAAARPVAAVPHAANRKKAGRVKPARTSRSRSR
jgi:hypothetical protein